MSLITTTDPIYFGGIDIVSAIPGWRTTGSDPFRYPSRDVQTFHIANSNLTTTTSAYFTGKSMNVRGVITRPDRELLDAAISEMRRILDRKNQTLQLPVSGNQRQYYNVTVANIAIGNVAGGYAEIDIEFRASDPHNYALTTSSVVAQLNLGSGFKSFPVTFEGTAKQEPIITYTLDSYTGSNSIAVTFSNPLNSQSITITRAWTATDLLIIDCKEKTVTVNGTAVIFTGNFPEWDTGVGFVNYSDGFSSRQVDISVTYVKRYL